MPIVLESSMCCYSFGKLISNRSSVGSYFVKVYESI